jgi:hypothetical protein
MQSTRLWSHSSVHGHAIDYRNLRMKVLKAE